LVVFYSSFYVVLKNWNRKCFWTSVVYILWNGLYFSNPVPEGHNPAEFRSNPAPDCHFLATQKGS